MALTNVFTGLPTEESSGSVDRNTGIVARQYPLPRNAAFVPRTVIDNTVVAYSYRTYMWDTGNYTGPWNGIAAFSVDQRQTLTEQTRTNAIATRDNRWQFG